MDFAEIIETRAYIHVYRPSKIVGALNMFSLKAMEQKLELLPMENMKFYG